MGLARKAATLTRKSLIVESDTTIGLTNEINRILAQYCLVEVQYMVHVAPSGHQCFSALLIVTENSPEKKKKV